MYIRLLCAPFGQSATPKMRHTTCLQSSVSLCGKAMEDRLPPLPVRRLSHGAQHPLHGTTFDCAVHGGATAAPQGHEPRRVIAFVDNAGADIVLGMLPLARELLRMGSEVVLAANTQPAINDITAAELRTVVAAAARDDPILRAAWEAGLEAEAANRSRVRLSRTACDVSHRHACSHALPSNSLAT